MMPDQAAERYHRALELYRSGHAEEAARELHTLLADFPETQDAYEALSVIHINAKRYDEAIEVLRKWVELFPDSVMSHTNLSRCYAAKGMILEAEREQAESRRLGWKAELKSKKQEMPKVDYAERIQRYKQVIELDPADVLGYFSLGNAYLDAGMKREAVDTFEKAVDVDASHSASYYGWGLSLEALQDFEKARRVYERGIKTAGERGDMLTQKKMESRLRALDAAKEGLS